MAQKPISNQFELYADRNVCKRMWKNLLIAADGTLNNIFNFVIIPLRPSKVFFIKALMFLLGLIAYHSFRNVCSATFLRLLASFRIYLEKLVQLEKHFYRTLW